MYKFRVGCVAACILFLALLTGNGIAAGKVILVPGVTEDGAKNIGNMVSCMDGVKEVLTKSNVPYKVLYQELANVPNDASKKTVGKEIAQKIREEKPAAIILLTDDSVKFVGALIDDIPIVFAFVYGDLQAMGLSKANMTGVTRRSFAPDIFGLGKKLTGAKTVSMLSKNNLPMVGIKQTLMSKSEELEKATGVRLLDMHLCDTFVDWENQVLNWSADLLFIADPSRVMKDGKELSRAQTVQWTVENSKVPVIAATEEDTEAGALFSILNSERMWGVQAGELVLKILSGTPVANIPIEPVRKGALVVNVKTAQKYKIDIPYEILSSAEKLFEQ